MYRPTLRREKKEKKTRTKPGKGEFKKKPQDFFFHKFPPHPLIGHTISEYSERTVRDKHGFVNEPPWIFLAE